MWKLLNLKLQDLAIENPLKIVCDSLSRGLAGRVWFCLVVLGCALLCLVVVKMGTVIRTLAGTCCQTLNQDKGCTLPFISAKPSVFGFWLKQKTVD